LMSDWVNPVLIEKTVAHQLLTVTCPRSRFFVQVVLAKKGLAAFWYVIAYCPSEPIAQKSLEILPTVKAHTGVV
jgi:hypothetical protein